MNLSPAVQWVLARANKIAAVGGSEDVMLCDLTQARRDFDQRHNPEPARGLAVRVPQDLADQWFVEELLKRGYRVTKDSDADWLTLSELAASVGRECNSLSRTISRAGGTVPGLVIERTHCGRIRRVRPSETFRQWLRTIGT